MVVDAQFTGVDYWIVASIIFLMVGTGGSFTSNTGSLVKVRFVSCLAHGHSLLPVLPLRVWLLHVELHRV